MVEWFLREKKSSIILALCQKVVFQSILQREETETQPVVSLSQGLDRYTLEKPRSGQAGSQNGGLQTFVWLKTNLHMLWLEFHSTRLVKEPFSEKTITS